MANGLGLGIQNHSSVHLASNMFRGAQRPTAPPPVLAVLNRPNANRWCAPSSPLCYSTDVSDRYDGDVLLTRNRHRIMARDRPIDKFFLYHKSAVGMVCGVMCGRRGIDGSHAPRQTGVVGHTCAEYYLNTIYLLIQYRELRTKRTREQETKQTGTKTEGEKNARASYLLRYGMTALRDYDECLWLCM